MSASDPPLDPRGVRFAAAVSAVVLALVLLTGSGGLLAAQAVVFALAAFAGPRFAPYPLLHRRLVAPRLAPPTEREDAAPVRFSQLVGSVVALVGAAGYLTGLTALGVAATAAAFVAALLHAALGFCPGCEIHALIHRFSTHRNPQGAEA